jgi:hypothetical protein
MAFSASHNLSDRDQLTTQEETIFPIRTLQMVEVTAWRRILVAEYERVMQPRHVERYEVCSLSFFDHEDRRLNQRHGSTPRQPTLALGPSL